MGIDTGPLKTAAYFEGLSEAETTRLADFMTEKKFARGKSIVFEGDPARSADLIVSGAVKLYKTSAEGKDQILWIARRGEVFNDVPVLDGGACPATAQAMTETTVYEIPRDALAAAIGREPRLAANATRALSKEVRRLLALVEDLSFRHVVARLARVLLESASTDNDGMRLTQQDMAAMIGTAREVVGRSLKELEDGGVVRMDRHRIVIADKKALKDMAEA